MCRTPRRSRSTSPTGIWAASKQNGGPPSPPFTPAIFCEVLLIGHRCAVAPAVELDAHAVGPDDRDLGIGIDDALATILAAVSAAVLADGAVSAIALHEQSAVAPGAYRHFLADDPPLDDARRLVDVALVLDDHRLLAHILGVATHVVRVTDLGVVDVRSMAPMMSAEFLHEPAVDPPVHAIVTRPHMHRHAGA